jgi:nucleotide-binding universal stress UspA family protein
MHRDLLVPLDGSDFAERAVPWAVAIARRAGGTVHLVLVHTPLSHYTIDLAPVRAYEAWEDSARRREAEYLEGRIVDVRWRGVEARAESLEGDAAERLIDRAARGIDLVVMATHGRTGFERAWRGSVAEEVVHHVRLPVLLVRPDDDAPVPADPSPRRILAATDGSMAASPGSCSGAWRTM